MAQRKASEDGKTQHQRFVEAARRLGTDEDPEHFRSIVRKIATAPVAKPKKGTRKSKA
jgi:hypothetical protein